MKTNIDYAVDVIGTTTVATTPFCSNFEFIKKAIERITEVDDKLLVILLAMGKQKLMLDGMFFDGEKELIKIYESLSPSAKKELSYTKFDKLCLSFFESFIKEAKKTYACFMTGNIRKEEGEIAPFILLRKIGLFPIPIPSYDKKTDINLPYMIALHLHQKIGGFITKKNDYEANKEKWTNIISQSLSDLPHLTECEELLHEINNADDRKEFTATSFNRFVNKRWKDKKTDPGKKGNIKTIKGIRTKLVDIYNKHGQDFQFTNIHKEEMRGYGPETINAIYKHPNLWLKKDVLSDPKYNSILIHSYHFQKDYIGVSTFSRNGGQASFNLGYNYEKFTMSIENDRLIVKTNKTGISLSTNLENHGQLRKLVIANADDERGKYHLEYYSDSQCKTKYRGYLREITLRFDTEENKIKMYLNIGLVHEANNPLFTATPEKSNCIAKSCPEQYVCANAKNCDGKFGRLAPDKCIQKYRQSLAYTQFYFASAPDPTKPEKLSPPKECAAIGVDLGITSPVVCASASKIEFTDITDTNPHGFIIKSNIQEIAYEMTDAQKKDVELAKSITAKSILAKKLIDATVRYVKGESQSIPKNFYLKQLYQSYDWEQTLNINEKDYLEEIKSLPSNVTEQHNEIVRLWSPKKVQWSIKKTIYDLRQDIANLRRGYHIVARNKNEARRKYGEESKEFKVAAKEKQEFTLNASANAVDSWKYMAIEAFCDLNKKTSGNQPGVNKELREYLDGIKQRIHNFICSEIVNIARAARGNNYMMPTVIFIEDLDCNQSILNDPSDNSLKRLMGVGELKKMLHNLANKHALIIVANDPFMSSRKDFDTKSIGYRRGKYLYVKEDNQIKKIDADKNAAKNLLWRGLTRHSDGCQFPIVRISENTYRLAIKEKKIKKKAEKENNIDNINDSFSEMINYSESIETEENNGFIEMGKRSVRSIKSHFLNGTAILENTPQGYLKVVKTDLSKEELNMPKYKDNSEKSDNKSKKTYMILDNKIWKLRDTLNQELNAIEKEVSPQHNK